METSVYFLIFIIYSIVYIVFLKKIKSKNFNYKVNKKCLYWIDEQLSFIITKMCYIRPKNLFLFDDSNDFYKNLTSSSKLGDIYSPITLTGEQYDGLRKVIRKIRLHLNIKKVPRIKISTNFNQKNTAASVKEVNDEIIINIDFSKIYSEEQLAAVLCHEFTHYYLRKYSIFKNDKNENEMLTEIASVYLGFGKIILKGYMPHSKTKFLPKINKKQIIENTLGYFNIEQIADVYVRLCWFYEIPKKEAIYGLNKKIRKLVLKKYNKNKKYYKFNKNHPKKIIMCCKSCKQNLRFPHLKKDLKLICPNCNNETVIYSKLFVNYNKDDELIVAPGMNNKKKFEINS